MKRLLVIGQIWPEPTTTAAGNRMLQLLEAFLTQGYQITFASTSSKTTHSADLTTLGVREVSIQLNDSSFDEFIKQLKPNIVLFDRFMVEEQFGWRVADHCPQAIRILNTEDLHSLREFRENCLKKNTHFSTTEWLRQDKTKREVASIYRSDLTLLVSSFEKQLLEGDVQINGDLLWHLPFLLEEIPKEKIEKWPKFEERIDFITYGNGRHAPNIDALNHLKKSIWPLIRKGLPQVQMHVYGAYLPQHIIEMNQPEEGFLVHGWIAELDKKVQQSRVVLAPLRFGAGIKGKLAKAMQNGTPSVTTKTGAEGMTKQPWPGAVADEPTEIAHCAIELYQNREKWQESQNRGITIVNKEYEKEEASKSFFQRLNSLKHELEEHRNKNFIGSLLQYKSMAATKYMGKWIEEKNRNSK